MSRIRLIGLALVAVFAMSAIAASAASAAEWKIGGVAVTSSTPVKSGGTLTLTDTGTLVGTVSDECTGVDKGTVEAGGNDTTTSITNAAGEKKIKCVTSSSCTSPTAEAVGLPWKTKLVEVGGKLEDEITNTAGKLGWLVECKVLGATVKDECTTKSTHTAISNVTAGVDAVFSEAVSGKATCTQSKKETGSVVGTDLNEAESGKLEAFL
jgi:hypothetical protein